MPDGLDWLLPFDLRPPRCASEGLNAFNRRTNECLCKLHLKKIDSPRVTSEGREAGTRAEGGRGGAWQRADRMSSYQALQKPRRPGDGDEELLGQLRDEGHLGALRALEGLTGRDF